MNPTSLTQEERILRMMKRVLTDIAKDTHSSPGVKQALSPHTIEGIRECLALITAREAELATETGRTKTDRPHFVDEPQRTQVIKLHAVKRKPDETKDN